MRIGFSAPAEFEEVPLAWTSTRLGPRPTFSPTGEHSREVGRRSRTASEGLAEWTVWKVWNDLGATRKHRSVHGVAVRIRPHSLS